MAMSSNDQLLNFYMPRIFWHDRKGILSIDVLQQGQTESAKLAIKNESDQQRHSIYKIVTASMQREIRVWNFYFVEKVMASATKKTMTSITEPKIIPILVEKPNATPSKQPLQTDDDEDSVMFLDAPEKENGAKNEAAEDAKVTGSKHNKKSKVDQEGDGKRTIVPQYQLSVEFLANIEGHRGTTNVVRFSPNGTYIASGDADGFLFVWKLELQNIMDYENEVQVVEEIATARKRDADPEMDIPPNKENWTRSFRSPIRHDGDVTGICWSPDSLMVASVSMDDSVAVHRADNGKRVWAIRNFRHFANGIAWDPCGKYLVAMSTDRRMDILDALKGTRLRCCHQIEFPLTPLLRPDNSEIQQKLYKVFHDDQLFAFQRGVEFSPCGGVVFAPAVHLEVAALNVYGVFVFLRSDLDNCRPTALYQTVKPAIQAKCSPIIYKLADGPNFLGLSHRLIFAVLCRDSVLMYSSQNEFPLAYIENLQYDKLTSMAWTPDGRVLVVSSMEGFNSFITMEPTKLGTPIEQQNVIALFGDEVAMSPLNKAKKTIRKRCPEK